MSSNGKKIRKTPQKSLDKKRVKKKRSALRLQKQKDYSLLKEIQSDEFKEKVQIKNQISVKDEESLQDIKIEEDKLCDEELGSKTDSVVLEEATDTQERTKDIFDFERYENQREEHIDFDEIFCEETTSSIGNSDIQSEVEVGKITRAKNLIVSKDKWKRKQIILPATFILLISLISGMFFMTQLRMPNLVGKTITDVETWSNKHQIELIVEKEFSTIFDDGEVIEQGVKAKKRIKKGDKINLQVSKGADPEELIDLKLLRGFNLRELEKWKDTNKAKGVKIVKEFHDDIPLDGYIRHEFKNTDLTDTTYKRKDEVTVYISKGKEILEKNIIVPDFEQKPLAEVYAWAESHKIKVNVTYEENESIPYDHVISQNIAPNEKVTKKSEIDIIASNGGKDTNVEVPWFGNISRADATAYSNDRMGVIVYESYSGEIGAGGFISQDVAAGTIITEGTYREVYVHYSLGLPYLDDLRNYSEADLANYFAHFQINGANIKYVVNYENNTSVPRGTVVRMSKESGYIGMNETIYIVVSN